MIDAELDKEQVEKLIFTYKPEYLWIPTIRAKHFLNDKTIYSLHDYSLIKLEPDNSFSLHKNLALLLPTSGSTGSPKLVKITYKNIISNAEAISKYLSISSNERPITSLPIHYSFGLSVINSHLINGSTILLTNSSLMSKEFWEFLKTYKATSMSGVPYFFQILKRLNIFKMDLSYLKTITQAGGKLNDSINKEFSEFCKNSGKRFIVMYGQTEASPRMSYLPPEYTISKLGSIGIPIPGGEFSLIDKNKKLINESETVGELVYKGENVSMGYAKCGSDLSKNDINNGILFTGDLAKRDSDGFYFILGRIKRFIKLFGSRVSLDETENLLKHFNINCACVGQDDKMIIYITDKNLLEDVISYVTNKTGINSRAFEVRYIRNIPMSSSGKAIYSKLPT